MYFRKDVSLDKLADVGNVAQFVSFSPQPTGLHQEYCRIAGFPPNHRFDSPGQAIAALLANSPDKTVNVRSYAPDSPRSREFVYGIATTYEANQTAERLATGGLHVIVNETVDVADGGVSGVVLGEVIEFSPDDTPRCVEKPGTASLPLSWGLDLIKVVYGVRLDIPAKPGRLEFSVHPEPRGWTGAHTIAWEFEEGAEGPTVPPSLSWPNNFSRLIGDKAYGLLMAHAAGLPVPRSLVIGRRVAPFEFGIETGRAEKWIRTCPGTPEPGLFTTAKGWQDPFALLAKEDPTQTRLASVISQAAIPATFSGAVVVDAQGKLVIEGVAGEGDRFMLGRDSPQDLPASVQADVQSAYRVAASRFGPVRFEWVHDGHRAWIVQMHRGATETTNAVVVPGQAETWLRFDIGAGLDSLREIVVTMAPRGGLILVGEVGLTSHIADLVRKAGIPTRLDRTGLPGPLPGMLL